MLNYSEITIDQPQIPPQFSRKESPYKGDPFTILGGHYIGDDGFVVPRNFNEFFERFPDYIWRWLRNHAYWCPAADTEDLRQDLLFHLQHLATTSKHRIAGANRRQGGCTDVIETFDPYRQHGASERRFRNFVNLCLANKLKSIRSKAAIDALSQRGNVYFSEETGPDSLGNVDDEFLHLNSVEFRKKVSLSTKQRQDRAFVREFVQFVRREDQTVLHTIAAVSETATHEDAAARVGVSQSEYLRMHIRLRELARSFVTGGEVPRPRRRYRRSIPRKRKMAIM